MNCAASGMNCAASLPSNTKDIVLIGGQLTLGQQTGIMAFTVF